MTFKCIIGFHYYDYTPFPCQKLRRLTLQLEQEPIQYPDYQNHEELDIEIEKTEAEECSKSNSKISIASADSGHQPSDPENDKPKGKIT